MAKHSKGHVETIAGFEYYIGPKGNLYRSYVPTTYIQPNGYRSGGRWECPAHMVEAHMETVRHMRKDVMLDRAPTF